MATYKPKQNYKALLFDYDALLEATDNECCFSLSDREVKMLLAIVDYALWKTRYFSTENDIDQETIARWGGNLARKLMSGCCPDEDILHRFNEDGVYESSADGGVIWTPDPAGDPRKDYVLAPPLPGVASDAKRCAAADNVREVFKDYRDQLAELLSTGSTVIAIIAGILAFIGAIAGASGVAIGISVLLISLAAELLTLTPSAVIAAINLSVLDDFRCLVYCRMDQDGQLSETAWNGLKSDIAAFFGGFPETFFYNTVNAMGYIGVSNAGTMGVATAADCEDCDCNSEWCYTWNFAEGDGGWTFLETGFGVYSPGVGFVGEAYGTGGGVSRLNKSFSDAQLTSIQVIATSSGYTTGQKLSRLEFNADPPQDHGMTGDMNGVDVLSQYNQLDFTPFDCDSVTLFFDGAASSDMRITSATIRGVGVNPFGEDNCI